MHIVVAYWEDGRLVERAGIPSELPTANVLWVQTPRRRLQGMDFYWIDGDRYGVYNEPDSQEYSGRQAVSWHLEAHGEETEIEAVTQGGTPAEATVFAGLGIPDEDARAVGLL